MARRYYGMNRGATAVTESSSTTAKDLEVSIDLAVSLTKIDVYAKLKELENVLVKSNWPAGTTLEYQKRWGLNRGQTEFSVGTAVASYATLTDQTLVYTAKTAGTAGNNITIELIDPPGNNVALSISVVGTAISVTLATNGASAITTTRAQLVAALQADAAVMALIGVTGAGATAITAIAATNLATGAAPVVSNDDVYVEVLTGSGLTKNEALIMLNTIENYIELDTFPPA